MINRRIQPADMAQWAVCIALDGGLREGEHETQAVSYTHLVGKDDFLVDVARTVCNAKEVKRVMVCLLYTS